MDKLVEAQIKSMKKKGMSNLEIGRYLGLKLSTVREAQNTQKSQ